MGPILITGASGFLGRHLVHRLPGEESLAIIGRKAPGGSRPAAFWRADLVEGDDLEPAIRAIRPRLVFHLAGRTPPATDPEFDAVNHRATARLLNALRALDQPVRVVIAGSAAELGPVPESRLPVAEDAPCHPQGAYAESKLQATRLAMKQGPPLEVMVARIFNPIGPGMPQSQAFGRFAWLLARARSARDPEPLTVGDLTPKRDFIDVRDVADALIALGNRGRAGRLYHIGTGQSRAIRDGLALLIERSCIFVPIVTDGNGSRSGPADSRADIGRIVGEVGWRPRISFEQSLDDLWDDLLQRLEVGPGVE